MRSFLILTSSVITYTLGSAIENHLYDSTKQLIGLCPDSSSITKSLAGIYQEDTTGVTQVVGNYFDQFQLDGVDSYYLLKNFYCPKGTFCPQTFAPILPTKGKYKVTNVSCDKAKTSFTLSLTEMINSLNIPVDPVNQITYNYQVTIQSIGSFITGPLILNSDEGAKKINKLNDRCSTVLKMVNQCDIVTGVEGTQCYGNKCRFIKEIKF